MTVFIVAFKRVALSHKNLDSPFPSNKTSLRRLVKREACRLLLATVQIMWRLFRNSIILSDERVKLSNRLVDCVSWNISLLQRLKLRIFTVEVVKQVFPLIWRIHGLIDRNLGTRKIYPTHFRGWLWDKSIQTFTLDSAIVWNNLTLLILGFHSSTPYPVTNTFERVVNSHGLELAYHLVEVILNRRSFNTRLRLSILWNWLLWFALVEYGYFLYDL